MIVKKSYILFLLIILSIVCLVCCDSEDERLNEFENEALTLDEYKSKLFLDSLYSEGMVHSAGSKVVTEIFTMIMEGLDYPIEDSYEDIDSFDIDSSIITYNKNGENYQIYNKIKKYVSPYLFSINNPEGFILLGDNYGFYIRTTPKVNEKISQRVDYKNFTPNSYYESVVILFKFNLNKFYDEETKELVLEEKIKCLGMFVFHTTTENSKIINFPNSTIGYRSTTILFEDLSSKGFGKLSFNMSYEIKNKTSVVNRNSSHNENNAGVNEYTNTIRINISNFDEILNIDYSVNVCIEENYELKNFNKVSFVHTSKTNLLVGDVHE